MGTTGDEGNVSLSLPLKFVGIFLGAKVAMGHFAFQA
jgi:hypothetical protein